ncbi:glycosyltransferase family 2 protein [Aerococcus tenax]|uniref:glycosyltransferase family 2 protein n=1 Tax=Aerococcus tenax TaxID=3078812 RepID=UPI0018A6E778|nr:glycosyltransferase family 2 protein [Aerococcus tenax]
MKELVSVVIPNYNRANIIQRAISSALNQTYSNVEVIVVDDCSTDNSKNILTAIEQKNEQVRVFFSTNNRGANYCRNVGVKKAKGKFIAFLDSDDEFLPDKISKCLEISNEKKADLVFSDFINHGAINRKFSDSKEINLSDIILSNSIGGFSVIFAKKNIIEKSGFLNENMPSCQDWDFMLNTIPYVRAYYYSGALVNYYQQADSITKNISKVLKGHIKIFKKINILNDEYQIYDTDKLLSHQKKFLGIILFKHRNIKEARILFLESLKIKFTFDGMLRYCSTFIPYDIIKYLKKLRNIIYIKFFDEYKNVKNKYN